MNIALNRLETQFPSMGISSTTVPRISVIIPTFNRRDYVCEAINSVLNQSSSPFEVIVVDDGSTDGTPELLRCFGSRIRLHQQPNKGVSAARNAGILLAAGEWVAFLDSDDVWEIDYLKCQAANILAHPEADAHHTDIIANDRDGTQSKRFEVRGFLAAFGSAFGEDECLFIKRPLSIVLAHRLCNFQSTVARKEKLMEAGLFPEDISLCEDWVLMSFLARGPINYCRRPLVRIYRRPNMTEFLSSLWEQKTLLKYEAMHRVFSRIETVPFMSPAERKIIRALLSANSRDHGNVLFHAGRIKEARAAFRKAWDFSPSLICGLKYVVTYLPKRMASCARRRRS